MQNHVTNIINYTKNEGDYLEKNENFDIQSYDKYFDRDYSRALSENIAYYIDKFWFRSELIGWDLLPERNNPDSPLIYFTNHSGMAFPWDAMIFGYRFNIKQAFGHGAVRALSSPMLSQSALMNPFTSDGLWNRMGSIDATFENFESIMKNKHEQVLIYPEGVPGIAKGFNNKYVVQQMKTSFLRMSIKYKTDIIPFFCINGEYINPYSYSSKLVNKLFNLIGIPFFPLGPISIFIVLQPWIFYFGFPAKLKYVLGKRIKPYEMINKPYDEISQQEFAQLAIEVQDLYQKQLDESVKKHGKNPYDFWGLIKNMFNNFRTVPYGMPWNWVILFYEFDRKYRKYGKDNCKVKMGHFHTVFNILKNPFTIFYFIPVLGLIPIAIRGYKGHRLWQNKNKKAKK